MTSGRRSAALIVAAVLVSGCTAAGGTARTRMPGRPAPVATRAEPLPQLFERGEVQAPVDALPDADAPDWHDCDDRDRPWECAELRVPMDYRHPATSRHLTIALTRLPATNEESRIGSLVMNPGGPGGSGVELAWSVADELPAELTERFDIVGFDPRGVGRSTPIRCMPGAPSTGPIGTGGGTSCPADQRQLLSFVGTANVARDLDMIRDAVGDARLTYLGFSYGTALGAVYADMFPMHTRALVLDGAVDPTAGRYNVDGTSLGGAGDPFYGRQDFDATEQIFFDLCDATRQCAAASSSAAVVDDVEDGIDDATTRWFEPLEPLDGFVVEEILQQSMYSIDVWPALAVALHDADRGDGSTMAALESLLARGYPAGDDSGVSRLANRAIYCADFAGRAGRSAVHDCDGVPESAEPLAPVTPTTTSTPVVVIGTDGDPATPGEQAPRMATALGSAVSVRWEGAGHTAFLTSDCVDSIVVDYLVDLTVPADHRDCPFTEHGNTVVDRAERVFAVDRERMRRRLTEVFAEEGLDDADAACVAAGVADRGTPSELVYARLGVRRPEYLFLRHRVERDCGVGG